MQLNQMTKMVMPRIKIKKLVIISVKKIRNHVLEMIQAIISCFEKLTGNFYSDETEAVVNDNSAHGYLFSFDVCCILNFNIWPKPPSSIETCILQLTAFKNVFDRYSGMKVLKVFTVDDVTEGFFWQ